MREKIKQGIAWLLSILPPEVLSQIGLDRLRKKGQDAQRKNQSHDQRKGP